MATPRCSRSRTAIGWSRRPTTRPTPFRSFIHATSSIGSRGLRFPAGKEPAWAAKGRNIADFWAPEMAKVGDEYWLAFTARQASNALAIGLARSAHSLGPWVDNGATADHRPAARHHRPRARPRQAANERRSDRFPHLRRSGRRRAYLFWKDDTNSIWPRPLAMLLRQQPDSSTSCSRARKTAARQRSPLPSSPGPISAADGALLR